MTDNASINDAIKARDSQITELQRSLGATEVRTVASDVIRAAGGDVRGLLPIISESLRAKEIAAGKFRVIVVDPKDPEKERRNARGEPMSVEELVAESREDPLFGRLFGHAGEKTRAPRTIRLTAEEARDPKRYRALKEQYARGEIAGVMDHKGNRVI